MKKFLILVTIMAIIFTFSIVNFANISGLEQETKPELDPNPNGPQVDPIRPDPNPNGPQVDPIRPDPNPNGPQVDPIRPDPNPNGPQVDPIKPDPDPNENGPQIEDPNISGSQNYPDKTNPSTDDFNFLDIVLVLVSSTCFIYIKNLQNNYIIY